MAQVEVVDPKALTTYSSTSGATTQVSQLPLHPDICFTIFKLVPNTTAICLSLTCRAAYANIFPGPAYLSPGAEKRDLLLLLEKDNPGLFCCFICDKLHTWKPDWSVNSDSIAHRGGCMLENSYHTTGTNYTISHCLMRLISNAQVLGLDHGLPPSCLDKDIIEEDSYTGVVQRLSWKGRYIGREIFLRTMYDISHPRGDDRVLRQFLDSSSIMVCMHLCIGAKPRDAHAQRLPELGVRLRGEFTPCNGVIVRCRSCQTDVEVTISASESGSHTGLVIRLFAYHNLGKGRTPFDPEWLGAIGACLPSRDQTRKLGPKVTFLKDEWQRSDSLETRA